MFRKVFLHTIMDKSAESGLKSMGNTMLVRNNPLEHREQLLKIPLNLKLFYATGPWTFYNTGTDLQLLNNNAFDKLKLTSVTTLELKTVILACKIKNRSITFLT